MNLGCNIVSENAAEDILIIENRDEGIVNMIVDIEEPILILEQLICEVPNGLPEASMRTLLQMNRNLIHGAFALDESAQRVIFRDTLQIENLDANEIEGSINSLSLALVENSNKLLSIAKN
ncbi:MAG: YbjN domain-containing protein [Spirochaetia bacterium]|nr:YbjN domain-containing protein [Spirochaetia bacterium]